VNRDEQLQRIRARCVELLAIAEKRTPGEWAYYPQNSGFPTVFGDKLMLISPVARVTNSDATFIAACAGPAEAGWKATIAAIDGLLHYSETESLIHGDGGAAADAAIDAILATWEGLV
jgi:hypothetical protein